MTKARLLDDDEAEQEFGPTIVVNEEFAKRFEVCGPVYIVSGWCYMLSSS
jgi:hypothetical protein